MGLALENHDRWLCQGDVFETVPLWQPVLALDAEGFKYTKQPGPAVLMSYDCALDKRNNAGELQIERITFLPVQKLENLRRDIQVQLRSASSALAPLETLYLGSLGTWGECFVAMSTPTRLPAVIFQPHPVQPDPLNARDLRAAPKTRDTRFGRLAEDRLALLRLKWVAYWTGRKLDS